MEIRAAIEARKALKRRCRVRLHSDSAYLVNCFRQRWYENWRVRIVGIKGRGRVYFAWEKFSHPQIEEPEVALGNFADAWRVIGG